MGDNWDDGSDGDDWDVSDDDLDARLGLNKKKEEEVPQFDDEVDLAVIEKAKQDKLNNMELKKKGNARSEKKAEEAKRKEEQEYAKMEMKIEQENEEKMTPEDFREYKRKQQEANEDRAVDDLFGGGGPSISDGGNNTTTDRDAEANGKLQFNSVVDHMKHAKKVGAAVKEHGKIHWTKAFIEETIKQCKDVLDADAVADIIKVCNVLKNEKVQASKRKVKGEASKIKKRDKAAERKAKQVEKDLFGDNDDYDEYDQMGGDYEDAFF